MLVGVIDKMLQCVQGVIDKSMLKGVIDKKML
jgi:hypothetical protein